MTRFLIGRDDALAERRWTLVVTGGPDRGAVATLRHETELIGAAPAATLALRDDTVSRYHAEVDLFAHALRVRDLSSTNGTANARGQRLAVLWVAPEGRFHVGETEITVRVEDEPLQNIPPAVGPIDDFNGLVATSLAGRAHLHRLRRLTDSDSDMAIEGRPGSGRRSAARALHERGRRQGEPFDIIDILRSGVEASAHRLHRTDGTVVLIGIEQLRPVDADRLADHLDMARVGPRFIAIVHRAAILDERLRRRFGTLVVRVPVLEERRADIPALVDRFASRCRPGPPQLGPRTVAALRDQLWPQQITQLSEVVETLAQGEHPTEDLEAIAALYWTELMRAFRGDVTHASRVVGLPVRKVFGLLSHLAVDVD